MASLSLTRALQCTTWARCWTERRSTRAGRGASLSSLLWALVRAFVLPVVAADSCAGAVIKSWDIGVATSAWNVKQSAGLLLNNRSAVLKGEKCVLTATSKYAYGSKGSPPKIPADATLVFEARHASRVAPEVWPSSVAPQTLCGATLSTFLTPTLAG